MNRTQNYDSKNLKSEDAFKHLVQTFNIDGVDGIWNDNRFFPLSEIPDETYHPEKSMSDSLIPDYEKRWELMDLIGQILEQAPLNPIERERIYLAFWRDMSMQEIGNFCGRSKSSIHESLHKAITKIKNFLDEKPQYHEVLANHKFI